MTEAKTQDRQIGAGEVELKYCDKCRTQHPVKDGKYCNICQTRIELGLEDVYTSPCMVHA